MEIPVSQPLDFNIITEICCYLASLIDPIYKSSGSSALILNDIGEMSVTKCGMKILLEINCHHPLAKLIVSAIENHYQEFGDGTKTFLLLLKEIVVILKKEIHAQKCVAESRLKFIDLIFSLISILPKLFIHVRSLPITSKLLLNYDQTPEFQFKQITMSFFSTKFPHIVAEKFSSLICRFICSSCIDVTDYIEINRTLQLVRNHFPLLVSKIVSPVTESTIIEGFIFSRTLSSTSVIDSKKVNFVICLNIFENDSVNKAVLKVKNSTEILEFVNLNSKHYLNFINSLKRNNISFILMCEVAMEEFKSICKTSNIFLLDGIVKDELEFILWYTNMVPLDALELDVELGHMGHAKHAETIVLGSEKYLHLTFASFLQSMPLCHMVISSPLKALCNEYYNECWNCIKMLSHFRTTDFGIASYDGENECSKLSQIFGMACPFSSWAGQLCNALESSSYANISMCNLQINSALRNILHNKFNDSKSHSKSSIIYLEPVICHETLLNNVLYLVVQLLKVDKIINVQKSIATFKNKI